jgi:hypothetical protein
MRKTFTQIVLGGERDRDQVREGTKAIKVSVRCVSFGPAAGPEGFLQSAELELFQIRPFHRFEFLVPKHRCFLPQDSEK